MKQYLKHWFSGSELSEASKYWFMYSKFPKGYSDEEIPGEGQRIQYRNVIRKTKKRRTLAQM